MASSVGLRARSKSSPGAVDYHDLGTATSGATFFRSIGGSFGVAMFGAILSNRLETTLAERFAGGAPGARGTRIS